MDCIGSVGDHSGRRVAGASPRQQHSTGASRRQQRATGASAREQRSAGASAREQAASAGAKGPTVGGHIGFLLPLVTRSGGQTVSNLTEQFAVGFPVGITVKGTGRMAFDLEFVPQINTNPRQTTLTVHPGLIYSLGHGFGVGGRLAFVVDNPTWGFTPLVNKSWHIKHNNSLFKAYFVEADLPVRFSRPVGAPATNAVTFAMHFGVAF